MSVISNTSFKHGAAAYDKYHCRCEVCVSDRKRLRVSSQLKLSGTEPPEHGTTNAYNVYKCRCEVCAAVGKECRRRYREKCFGQEPVKHGLTGHDWYGCRCEICKQAKKQSHVKRRGNPIVVIDNKERSWKRIGIRDFTYADFCSMYELQNGKCFICGMGVAKQSKNKMEVAQVDHDHATGKARSLLCHNCNKMLGCGRESKILRLGAEYLNRHNGDQS